MKTHCMVDLETFGTSPGSVIVSIGAVAFNQQDIIHRFYTNISIDSCLRAGLTVDGGALKFWLTETSEQNRKDLFDVQPRGLREALAAFTTFYQISECRWLWSRGVSFDPPMLAAAYEATGHGAWHGPWDFRKARDTRTLFSLLPEGKAEVPRGADRHNALADAEYEVLCVQWAYKALGKEMET